jgi:hypothetical protein
MLPGTGVRHPIYSALKPIPATRAKKPCAALAGTFPELAGAAGVTVERAVFPLLRSPFLAEEERDALWAWFRVPVLGILLDARGRVIGYECEVQDGFHLAPGRAAGAFGGPIETAACDCGRPGPRLMREKPVAQAHGLRA